MSIEKTSNISDTTRTYLYRVPGEGQTSFTADSGVISLNSLFGLTAGFDGRDDGPVQAKGLAVLASGRVNSERCSFLLKKSIFTENGLTAEWSFSDTGLELTSVWSFCNRTGVWKRSDSVSNKTDKDVLITRCLARFVFSPGNYEIYSQGSSWCRENEGVWQKLHHGSFILGSEGGRTTQGATPYLCIRETKQNRGVVFHVIPNGNWVIKVHLKTGPGNSLPFAVVEAGLADENLELCLKAGNTLELPEILIQELKDGDPVKTSPALHRYLLENMAPCDGKKLKIVYNTWLDHFDMLNTSRLENQLSAAAELGCEVFVVDAGWYGAGNGNWFEQAGDWKEKINGGFYGRMQDFVNAVRKAGLGFGLWMEPERVGSFAIIAKEHPDWIVDTGNNCFYYKLELQVVREYLFNEICRLINTYRVAWLKLDFNTTLGVDPSGSELSEYYRHWYDIMERLRNKYPDVFFESCSSGAARLDIQAQLSCDAHFISDNAEPSDVLSIYQGAMLRLLPGHITKWAVMRPVSGQIPVYGEPLRDNSLTILTADGATWEVAKTADLGYLMLVAMPGVMGISGDIAGFTEEYRQILKYHINFYKKNRSLIYNSIGYQLTPLWTNEAERNWNAVQLQDCRSTDSIVFVYRLEDSAESYCVMPKGLDQKKQYKLNYHNCKKDSMELSGSSLMEDGVFIKISTKYGAMAVTINEI